MTNGDNLSNAGAPTEQLRDSEPTSKGAWYRRRGALVVVCVLVVAAAAVVVDLPSHASRVAEISSDTAVINEVNSDISDCTYALKEALAIYAAEEDRTLTQSDAGQVPGLLSQDQDGCSFTNSSILDLSDIESPGSRSGKELNQMVSTVTTWSTSDALATIEDVQKLIGDPDNATDRTHLRESELLLASDRAAADAQVQAAEKAVSGHLPTLLLTRVVPLSAPTQRRVARH